MKSLPSVFNKYLAIALIVLIPGLAWGQTRTKIFTHPSNVTKCAGAATVVFKITMAKSIYGYTYQWQVAPYKSKIFQPVSVVTHGIVDDSKATLTMEFNKTSGLGLLTTTWDHAQFRCVVVENIKGAVPETSNIAYLNVLTSPSITNQPDGATKNVGESITFSISASGSTPRTYQWQFDDGSGYSNISGATGTSYTIANIQMSDDGTYRCRVTNTCGTRYSSGAVLTVIEPVYDDGWFLQTSNTSKDIKQVSFTSLLNGWACVYDPDKLLHTTDGGTTWSVTSTGYGYWWYSIHFNSASTGFLGTSSIIARTENGGSSWTRYNFYDSLDLEYSPTIYDFYFHDANTGWAVGRYGVILKTIDGGDSWIKQNFNGSPIAGMDGYLYSVWFIDSQNGWVAGENGKIYHTIDGGLIWTEQTTPNSNNIYAITFTDANHGFAGGQAYGNLLVTSNGGTNWDLIPSSRWPYPSMVPNSIHFTSSTDGWIAGYRYDGAAKADILRTNDGGYTWHRQFTEEGGDQLKHLVMVDSENGWAVGNTGTILRTATGGCLIPTVNLGADSALCASESYTMNAESFSQNLNCSYLWNTGDTLGELTVYETGDYSVTVTNLCGVTAGDSKMLEFYLLPPADAGPDTFMCYGDTIQLNASGGVNFNWSPSGTLMDPNIQNPRAFPTSSTRYYVWVTDTNTCEKMDYVDVTVYPIPTSTFTAPEFVCGTDNAAISYKGSASGGANYMWDFDGGTDTPSGGNHYVSWAEIGMKTISLVVEENTCISDTTWHDISVNPVPVSEFTLPAAVCDSDQVDIVYSGTDSLGADYDWNFDGGTGVGSDEGPYQVSWTTEGTKTVSLLVTQEGCESALTQKDIDVNFTFPGTEICIVTIDSATEKFMVVWEKPVGEGIESFNVYRQTSEVGVYELLANVPYDNLSVYVDNTSEPKKKQHTYKISAVDSCGESPKSAYHKTVLLQFDDTDGEMIWSKYEIEDEEVGFTTYIIFRGTDSLNLVEIGSVAGDDYQYTDTEFPTHTTRRWYRVAGLKATACYPTVDGKKAGTGPYQHSLSNLDDNKKKIPESVNILSEANKLRVFPNPFQEKVRVEYLLKKPSEVKIEVFNILGVRVLEVEHSRQLPGLYHYDISATDLEGGSIYYLRFNVDNKTSVTKLIPAR